MKLSWFSLYAIGITCSFFMSAEKTSQPQKKSAVKSVVKQEQKDASNLTLLDTVVAVVYGEEDTFVITKSDLDRPGIDGITRSLNDRIMEALLYSEAKKYKMLPTKEAVEKHLQAVQQEHNLTKEELYNIFRTAGYTPEEGKEQFSRLSAISSLIDYRIRSRLIIPEKDIIAYYDEHPVWEDPSYQLQRSFVQASNKKDLAKLKQELEQFVKTGVSLFKIDWEEPMWFNQDEIAESWNFIKQMNVDEVKIAQETDEGFELVKLIAKKDKRKKSLDEQYRQIADILRRPKYEELLTEYKKGLLESASVVYFETAAA